MDEERTRRLKTLFDDVINGKKTAALNNPKLFLEAVCKQTPAVTCISRLVASTHGLKALLLALSSDTSLPFLNGELTTFLEYIKALQTVCGGDVIRQILTKLVEAPLTWESLVKAAQDQALDQRALSAFAWLLIQLLSFPVHEANAYLAVAQDPAIYRALMSSSDDIGRQGQQIVRIAKTLASEGNYTLQGPGGRHDNDFPEIQRISIYPTQDELRLRTLDLYLPRASDVQERIQNPDGLAVHIDSQFRLLREDMLCELREELTALTQPKEWRRKPLEIRNLALNGVHCDKRFPWSLRFKCMGDLPQFRNQSPNKRKKFLKDHPKFLKNGFLVCLFIDNELITLGTLVREENLLVKTPSILCIQIPATNVEKVLMQLKNAGTGIRLLHVDTAIFTYEPVLKQLQGTQQLLLTSEILAWQPGTSIPPPEYSLSFGIKLLLKCLSKDYTYNLQSYLRLDKPTILDKAQAECFRAALQQRVVLIQGPPGTGKSFIGSLIGKAIHQCSTETILVVCYTHHALDDFVEDLLNLGIPSLDIVRLGSSFKATDSTKPLALKECKQDVKFTREQFRTYRAKKQSITGYATSLRNAFYEFDPRRSTRDLLKFLESYDDDLPFYSALQVPKDPDGMTWVGSGGEELDECYLLNRWVRGKDAGIFNLEIPHDHLAVWHLEQDVRKQKENQWYHEMSKDSLALMCKAGKLYNHAVEGLDAVFLQKDLAVVQNKRIIACTTTAAAKYSDVIQAISPGVLLVEEAGEILESHVLTALAPRTKHLILIGDHKQLRPKVNYELSVEKGAGYDLNRSLFERLILKEFPHQTLFSQHRMRPEISALVREMTYPELEDANETQGRPELRGFTDYIIFVNHNEPESELSGTRELGDSAAVSSKQNLFEAKMTLKCVRYLGQQGYRADDIVVLTPYLGQLRLLHDELKVDNDPVLNDLDSHDLIRAGLMPEATPEVNKPRLRISTIDNFQGEEANIVVASLTRSNSKNDIGFMFAPERLNVLISRARNALILIGNAEHFMGSRKGGDLWKRFIGLLKADMHVYNGFPIRCERHPDRTATLQKPADFDTECPDGGCKEPCNEILSCGMHKCPDRCHYLLDHSKIKCKAIILLKCDKGHVDHRECHDRDSCAKCEIEEAERKQHLLQMAENQKRKDEEERIKTAKEHAIALEEKKNSSESTENIARRKLTSNDTSNTLIEVANAIGVIPEWVPNSRRQQVLQSAISDCEVQTIRQSGCLKSGAAKQQAIVLQRDNRDLLTAENFAERKLASCEIPNTLAMENTNEWTQNRVPNWQDLVEKAKSEYEIQAARTETMKQQIIALEQTKTDLQIAEDVAESNLATDKTLNALTEGANSAGVTPEPTSDIQWRHLLLRTKIDLEIQVARTKAAKQQITALEHKKWDLETDEDAERQLTADETPNIRTVGAKFVLPSSNPALNTVISQSRARTTWRSSKQQHCVNMLNQSGFSIMQRARPLGSRAPNRNKPRMLYERPRFQRGLAAVPLRHSSSEGANMYQTVEAKRNGGKDTAGI